MAHRDGLPITAGPSKFDVMASLFDGKEISFTVANEEIITILYSVEAESGGTRESWNIRGHIPATGQKLSGHYSTKHRSGQLLLT